MAVPAFAVERLSTPELAKHIKEVATGQKQLKYVIDNQKAALSLGREPEAFVAGGGFFSASIPNPGDPLGNSKIMVNDNLFKYMWQMQASESRHLEGPGYVNIIAQFDGTDQPELLKYVKEGDVVVYWHPEYADESMDTYQQWRATHAATIVEVEKDGKTLIATADIPAGYARPFNGSARTPAHVFRYVARDAAGNIIPNVEAYGKQIARWATMAFGRFGFNGDYGSMSVRRPIDLKGFAREYLDPNGEIPEMYCAWYAYTNVNLGVMCPLGSGCVENNFSSDHERLTSQDNPFSYIGDSNRGYSNVMYGEGKYSDYATGAGMSYGFDKFAVKPLTAQNLMMNFFDRVIGTDKDAAKTPQTWVAHAMFKAGALQQQKDSFMYNFRTRAGRVIPTVTAEQDGSGYTISEEDAEAYTEEVGNLIDQFAYLYKQSAEKVGAGEADPVAEEQQIRAKLKELLDTERAKPTGRRWIPPYGFAAEAEAVEQYLLPEGEKYLPAMVYVGTIIHYDSYLKEAGSASQNYISPKGGLAADPRDAALDAKILAALGIEASTMEEPRRPEYNYCSNYRRASRQWRSCRWENRNLRVAYEEALAAYESGQSNVDATEALFEALMAETEDNYAFGLNPYESAALKAVLYHWQDEFPEDEDELASDRVQELVKAHNNYGMDPVTFKRWLVSYWNSPKSVRPTLYDVENGGKLFKLPSNSAELATLTDADAFFSLNSEVLSDAERKSVATNSANDPTDAQPRLDEEIVCGGDRGDQRVPLASADVIPNCN